MKIVIPTCDNYCGILEAQKYTMDKFGGSDLDVTVLGYKKPAFDFGKWKFVCLGEDTGPNNFTYDLWRYFHDFDDEYFIYGNDDVIVVDDLDLELLDDMEETMNSNPNVMKICVTSAAKSAYKRHTVFDDRKDFKYIELSQRAKYRLSLHYGIWRTSYFKKYFQFGINPWQWELRNVARNDGAVLLGTSGRHFLDFGHVFRYGGVLATEWYKSEYTGKKLSIEDNRHITEIILKTIIK